MPGWKALRGGWRPTAVVVGCLGAALLLTGGLAAAPPAASGTAATAGDDLTGRASGELARLLPEPDEWGYGWVADDAAASQQLTDGPGLVHPCGVRHASDADRVEVVRRSVAQDERDVPGGMAMTFELSRYRGDGARRALQERSAALQGCAGWRTTFAGFPDTPVDVALIAAPAGGQSTGAHLVASPDTAVGLQAVEYTYLVAQQGDVLLSAVVGNGNGQGAELDAFAAGYFSQARRSLAGLPAPSPERASPGSSEASA